MIHGLIYIAVRYTTGCKTHIKICGQNRPKEVHIKMPVKIKKKDTDGDHIFYSFGYLVELSCQARYMVIYIILL